MKKKLTTLFFAALVGLFATSCTLNEVGTTYTKHTLTVSASQGGTVLGGEQAISHNSPVTLKAIPDAGYIFVGWYETSLPASPAKALQQDLPVGQKVSDDSIYTFIVVANRQLEAYFKDNHLYTIQAKTVDANFQEKSGMGNIAGEGNFRADSPVTLIATPSTGYHFGGWYSDPDQKSLITLDSTYSLVASTDLSLYAMFVTNNYQLSLDSNIPEAGTLSGAGVYAYGTQLYPKATANAGYRFDRWVDTQGNTVSLPLTLTQDISIKAIFVKTWLVTVSNDGFGAVAIAGYGTATRITVDEGSLLSLEATPLPTYFFLGWFNSTGQAVSPDNPYMITVTGNVTLKAEFTTNANGSGTITDWTNNPIDPGTAN